ncbi:MAG: glycosyltransferase family 4 protein [Rhizobacter sp.]|nr:glycosyltransferase family 4 protein [Bacteriovorax sp.]
MKKTLYVSPNGFIGGAEKILMQIADLHFHKDESKVLVLTFNPGPVTSTLEIKNIPNICLKNSFHLSSPLKLIRAMKEIRSIVSSNKIEIVHSTMAYGHLVMSLATFGMKVKRVWFQHGPVDGLLDKIASLFPVNSILFNSKYLLELHDNSNKLQFPASKYIIPLGIAQPQLFTHAEGPLLRFVLIGRLSPMKGFDKVLKALCVLKLKNPEVFKKINVRIVGEANFPHEKIYRETLLALARDLGQTVEFLPFQNDMSGIYTSSDILIQPSLKGEGFGLVLAEAMSYGLLVVGPDYGGGTQILTNHKTGLTFNFKDSSIDELEIFLTDLIINFKNLSELQKNGQTLIAKNYTNCHMIKEVLNTYEQL